MKKFLAVFSAVVLGCVSLPLFAVNSKPKTATAYDGNVLRIYNWEDYIKTDEESGATMADEFEAWYNSTHPGANIRVEYSTFGTNEIMYNELKLNSGKYDLVCPSDYMIMKMIKENMVEPFSDEFKNSANPDSYYAQNVSPYIKKLFDENKVDGTKPWSDYAACYMWGTLGLVYNPRYVSPVDAESWTALWRSEFKNKTTIKDSVRDTYFIGVAYVYREELTRLNDDYERNRILFDTGIMNENDFNDAVDAYQERLAEIFNDTSAGTIAGVGRALRGAKGNSYSLEVDSGKNDVVTGKVYINFAWSGDAVYAMDEAEDGGTILNYSVPKEGSNIWFDGFVMPKGANKTLAEAFLNYISQPDKACENMDYIGYTSAIAGDAVFQRIKDCYEIEDGEEALDLTYFFEGSISNASLLTGGKAIIKTDADGLSRQLLAQYPSEDIINRCAVMEYFDDGANKAINAMWEEIKAETTNVWKIVGIVIICLIGAGAVSYGAVVAVKKLRKRGLTRVE